LVVISETIVVVVATDVAVVSGDVVLAVVDDTIELADERAAERGLPWQAERPPTTTSTTATLPVVHLIRAPTAMPATRPRIGTGSSSRRRCSNETFGVRVISTSYRRLRARNGFTWLRHKDARSWSGVDRRRNETGSPSV
jgi:hypothetical protein